MTQHMRYCLTWITEEEPNEPWLCGEQIPHEFYCKNKNELMKRYQQAVTEQGYLFEVYVWNQNQYMLTNINLKGYGE